MILVTGGAGYVGSMLVPELLRHGYRVRVFDKLYFGKKGLEDILSCIELVQGDVRDFDDRVLDGAQAVIHLAALSNDPTAEFNPRANVEINARGTEIVASACKKKGIRRFIYASSCSIFYSADPHDRLKDEESPVSPTAPYSVSKLEGEKILCRMASEDFCPVILRKGTVFGFSPRMRYDLVVNTFVRDAFKNGRLNVEAGGEMWRPLVDIKDVAHAYILCLRAPEEKVRGQIFSLVHKNYRILELAHWVKEVLKKKKNIEVDVSYVVHGIPRSYRVSGRKIFDTLGFEPRLGIAQAVNEIWDLLENGQFVDFDNPLYYNIRWMKLLLQMEERLKEIGRIF